MYRKVGEKESIAYALQDHAQLYASMGQVVQAVRLWSAAETLCEKLGALIFPSYRPRFERAVAQAHAQLGEEAFEQAWAEGRAMDFDQAIASVLSDSDS